MRLHFHPVWIVALREIRATVKSKAFWFFTLLYPIIFVLPILGLLWAVVALEEEDADLNEIFPVAFDGILEEWRHNLRGEPLYYCVVDETDMLSERIRYQIDKNDRDSWVEQRGLDKKEFTIEMYQEWRDAFDPYFDSHLYLSLNHFRELDEPIPSIETLNMWLYQDKIAGYFVLPKNLVLTNDGARFVQKKRVGTSLQLRLDKLKRWYEVMITQTLREYRFRDQQVDPEQFENAVVGVSVEIVSVNPSISEDAPALSSDQQPVNTSSLSILKKITSIPYIALLALVWGGGSYLILTSSIEEKTSKVGEILFSSMDPLTLMDGKVLGNVIVVGIGLAAWLVIIGLPTMLVLADSVLLREVLHPIKILNFLIFGAFAFASFGYLNAALGSACSDIKDTLYVNQPFALIGFFVVLPMLIYVLIEPDSSFAATMSFIPPLTPLFMIARTASLPDLPTYLLIVLIMSASLVAIRQFSVRIFTPGLLLERKAVGLSSLFRLARQSK